MKLVDLVKYAAGASAAAAMLAACSSGGSGSALGPVASGPNQTSMHLSGTLTAVKSLAAVRPDSGRSWMSPDKKKKKAKASLWISDSGTDDVYVYSLPSMKLSGTITGFSEPQGMCANSKGDVWVANTGDENVEEFAPGGTSPISTLSDPTGYPVGCAVDPTTGNLAVTNIFNTSGAGEVLVYKNASGSPSGVTNPSQYYYYFVGYDNKGNLYTDGKNSDDDFILSGAASGSSSAHTITLSGGTVYFPGMTQWDTATGTLEVGDQLCGDTEAACVYTVSLSNSTSGSITKTTTLENYDGGSVCDMVQGYLNSSDNTLGGGDYEYCGSASTSANTWGFPAGGKPTAYVTSGLSEPIGAAITGKVKKHKK